MLDNSRNGFTEKPEKILKIVFTLESLSFVIKNVLVKCFYLIKKKNKAELQLNFVEG